uniref:Splicing factor, arginine/serine-rich 12 n=1 Tax=Aegilops tauschii TaxID=37682 RepID=R7W228_AEGTA
MSFYKVLYVSLIGKMSMSSTNKLSYNYSNGLYRRNFVDNERRNVYINHGRRRTNERARRADREESIRRTVYVSELDHTVTEERLAETFANCGQVVDCRICGDPHSVMRFAFIEFSGEEGARAALNLGGTMLGFYPVRVLPSKTAILPVNPKFLPAVTQLDVKSFFEELCGEVSRLRLLGDNVHSTRIAFVEFVNGEPFQDPGEAPFK